MKGITYGINPKFSPCMGCDQRNIECHADCEKFASWKEAGEKIRKKKHELSAGAGAAFAYRKESRQKSIKRHKRRVKKHC